MRVRILLLPRVRIQRLTIRNNGLMVERGWKLFWMHVIPYSSIDALRSVSSKCYVCFYKLAFEEVKAGKSLPALWCRRTLMCHHIPLPLPWMRQQGGAPVEEAHGRVGLLHRESPFEGGALVVGVVGGGVTDWCLAMCEEDTYGDYCRHQRYVSVGYRKMLLYTQVNMVLFMLLLNVASSLLLVRWSSCSLQFVVFILSCGRILLYVVCFCFVFLFCSKHIPNWTFGIKMMRSRLVARGENCTDIIRPYFKPNSFRGV